MKYLILMFMTAIAMTATVSAQEPKVRVTIYNDNLALINEVRELDLPKPTGIASFQDVAAQIDPTSVHFRSLSNDEALRVLEQNFEYDLVSADKILRKYIDRNITLSTKQGTSETGKLLSVGGDLVLQAPDNSIRILNKSEIIATDLPELPEGLITRPTLVWMIENRGPRRQEVEVSYLTTGMNWHAEYVGVLDEKDQNLALGGWVSIDNNCGITLPDAQLLLIAGSVHRARRPPRVMREQMMAMAKAETDFEEKQFFEYHLYTLSRPSTLKNNQQKQIELLPSVTTPVVKQYTYQPSRHPKQVRVTLLMENTKKNGLGMALPGGKIRVYKPEGRARVLVGEDFVEHTPRDEKVEITVGDAFDIVGERTQVSFRQVDKRSNEERVEIEIRNHKDEAIVVKVVENFSGDWNITQESKTHNKKNATTAEWELKVDPNSEETVNYTVFRKW